MRKAAEAMPYRVWSLHDGAWWMVDHGSSHAGMVASTQRRQAFVTTPHPKHGVINPLGWFVITGPGQTPERMANGGHPLPHYLTN